MWSGFSPQIFRITQMIWSFSVWICGICGGLLQNKNKSAAENPISAFAKNFILNPILGITGWKTNQPFSFLLYYGPFAPKAKHCEARLPLLISEPAPIVSITLIFSLLLRTRHHWRNSGIPLLEFMVNEDFYWMNWVITVHPWPFPLPPATSDCKPVTLGLPVITNH